MLDRYINMLDAALKADSLKEYRKTCQQLKGAIRAEQTMCKTHVAHLARIIGLDTHATDTESNNRPLIIPQSMRTAQNLNDKTDDDIVPMPCKTCAHHAYRYPDNPNDIWWNQVCHLNPLRRRKNWDSGTIDYEYPFCRDKNSSGKCLDHSKRPSHEN